MSTFSTQLHADLVPGWKTTAFGKKIEFGSSRNGHDAPQLTGNNKDITLLMKFNIIAVKRRALVKISRYYSVYFISKIHII